MDFDGSPGVVKGMNPGDKVDVNRILVERVGNKPPVQRWVSGYIVLEVKDDFVLVKNDVGRMRYYLVTDVRLAENSA